MTMTEEDFLFWSDAQHELDQIRQEAIEQAQDRKN
jgi:hypothetical protein